MQRCHSTASRCVGRAMRVAGFAFLAAAVALVAHAYEPGSFDPDLGLGDRLRAEPPPPAAAAPPARNFAMSKEPTLRSLQERAAIRQARVEAPAPVPVVVAVLPTAMPAAPPAAGRPVPEPMSALAPRDDTARGSLVRNIKRELRRVGCFGGSIDDDWDAGARGAAESFMDRVNATLPNTPDHVLLALIRNHKASACTGTCPRGQSMSGEGRCMPDAIVAKMTRGSTAAGSRKPAVTEPFTTTVTVAEVQTTAGNIAPPDGAARPTAKRAPLPGRMAMGAAGSGSEASGGWWDGFMTPDRTTEPAKAQTLDRPVGLTHVPTQPAMRNALREDRMRTASVTREDGLTSGPALQPAAIGPQPTSERAERPRRSKGSRAYRARGSRSRTAKVRHARRWSGRNVQTMFQHPLGRM